MLGLHCYYLGMRLVIRFGVQRLLEAYDDWCRQEAAKPTAGAAALLAGRGDAYTRWEA